MKPCSSNRKLIAWLALDALDAREAAGLRKHLALCEGCRCYREEITNVTEALAAGPPDSNLEASESFHRGVAERLQAVDSPSGLEGLAAWLRGSTLSWRVALPTVAVLVSVLLAVLVPRRHSVVSLPTPPTIQAMSVSDSGSDLAPTLANYQMVANQSLEELSELLTQQGNKSLPPAPMYTVSSLELVDSPF